METEKFGEEIVIYYDGDFAGAIKEKGDVLIEKSLQLLNYMKGKGYRFVGTSTTIAYFEKQNGKG